jgi:DNA-directed RNA polymerase subunit H (RpoH/RPB5)
LAWVTPEEMMAMKLKMGRKQLPKIAKQDSRSNLERRMGKKVFNTANNEISGWNIH